MKTYIVERQDELESLRDGWVALEEHAELPMQQFIWARACAETFEATGAPRILAAEEGNKLVAIAPLFQNRRSTRLEMLGVDRLYEPMDVLCASEDCFIELARALVDQRKPLLFRRLSASSHLPAMLQQAFRRRGVFVSRPDSPWPSITLHPGWAEPESQMNSKRRAYLRRAHRTAENLGKVESEVLTPTPESLGALLGEALRIEASGWKGQTGSALAVDPVVGTFYRRYAAAACERGILRICFLRINGKAIAMQLAIETGRRLWLLKIGYDEQFSVCSPGNLLVRETIGYAARRGLHSIAFLGAMESWKSRWTDENNSCLVLRGYPIGWSGAAGLVHDAAQTGWHKLIRSLPNGKEGSL